MQGSEHVVALSPLVRPRAFRTYHISHGPSVVRTSWVATFVTEVVVRDSLRFLLDLGLVLTVVAALVAGSTQLS